MIEKILLLFSLAIWALIKVFNEGRKNAENKAKNQSLTDTIIENEETRKAQTKFNDSSDADKSKWLLDDMEKRNKDSKRFLQ